MIDVAEDLLGAAELATVEEELQTEISGGIDTDSAAFGLAIGVDAGRGSTSFAKAFFESFADYVG